MNSKTSEKYNISLILKCTRQCNLACKYCTDYKTNPHHSYSLELLASLFKKIEEDDRIGSVQFIWHGGEPLLLGMNFFQKVIFLQKRLFEHKTKFFNILQTNATLITHEWAAFFKKNKFNIGISLDGTPSIHNKNRKTPSGKNSFDQTLNGLEILKEHNVSFGVLTVVTEDIMDLGCKELFSFYRKLDINNCGVLALRQSTNNSDTLLKYNKEYKEFMTSLLKTWLEEDDLDFSFRELQSKLDMFLGLPNRVCNDGESCVGRYYGVESDGSIWHCDKFRGNSKFLLGNIFQHSFDDIISSEKLAELKQYELSVRQLCSNCKWYYMCKGGCLASSIALMNAGVEWNSENCPTYAIFEEMSKILARSRIVLETITKQA